MDWQAKFGEVIEEGKHCPLCPVGFRIQKADYTAYSWRCDPTYGRGKYHSSAAFVKWYKNSLPRTVDYMPYTPYAQPQASSTENLQKRLDELYKELYKDLYAQKWPWVKEEKKEQVGDTNEFGEICP